MLQRPNQNGTMIPIEEQGHKEEVPHLLARPTMRKYKCSDRTPSQQYDVEVLL